ncbi:MAG: Crp/Fnr family transcriptional regulator [Gammaproteobacteria bacterium]
MASDFTWFPKLVRADLELLAKCGTTKRYKSKTVLITEGEPSHELYIVQSGLVRVYTSEQSGKEVTLIFLGPWECFGELGLLDDAPRSASVATVETSTLDVVSKPAFLNCLSKHPEISIKLMQALVGRVRLLTGRVRDLALLDVYGRIARSLMSLATERDGQWVIEQRMTQQDLASLVGCAREMVARVMKDLTTGGYVEVKGKHITIKRRLPDRW